VVVEEGQHLTYTALRTMAPPQNIKLITPGRRHAHGFSRESNTLKFDRTSMKTKSFLDLAGSAINEMLIFT
jgi:hypothetical protein